MNSPAEIAKNYLTIGKNKVNTPVPKMFLLAMLAGMFIGMGAVAATAANGTLGAGVGAFVFPGGLAMVLVAGSELFTGNSLIVIPLLQGEVSIGGLLKNWVVVYLGNLVGSLLVAFIAVQGGVMTKFGAGTVSTALSKCSLSFSDALLKGIGCNFLVCIAVWMSFAAKDVVGKIVGLYLPIMMFVIAGFEHSVANMTYIPMGLFANQTMRDAAVKAAEESGKAIDLANLSWGNFFISNLLPVTIGNIIGGGILVGCVYWFVYLSDSKNK
ncbi:Formate efflux transporter [Lachnospiraceae bacterium TWA4]|nr:Formate efflux transporter [Lachnospiraceae bacterium TWA4]